MDSKASKENIRAGSMVRDLTSGSVMVLLLKFAMPLFAANALQALYNIVDMIVVGQVIGGAGMSAVSVGGDVLHILTFVAMGFSSAGQVIIARYVGAGRMDSVRKLIGTMFTFLLGISLVISLICLNLRESILSLVNTPAEAYDFTMDYLVVCTTGLIFIYGYNIVSAILRGMGDSRRPFYFVALAAVLNTVLDIIFVGFMGMEVWGAAFATVIGQGMSFLASMAYLYIHRESFGFDFKLKSFAVKKEVLYPLVMLGIPMAIQSASVSLSKIVLTAWVNLYGVTMSAIGGIYSKNCLIIGVVSNSFTTAGSSMIGQNLGAGKYERVPAIMGSVLVLGGTVGVICTIAMLTIPDVVFGMFTGDQDVILGAAVLVGPMIVNFFGCATRNISFALINGSGKSALNFIVALIDGLISRVGLAALLGFYMEMGCLGFWYGDALAGWAPFVVGALFFLSGRWKSAPKGI